ncbi:hypothetical protein Tco_0387034 [Tanacetum coccineum]
MQKIGIMMCTIHAAMQFHAPRGVGIVFSSYESNKVVKGYKKVKEVVPEPPKDILSCDDAEERIVVNYHYPEQTIVIGKHLPMSIKRKIQELLRTNADVFAWIYADMTGIPRIITIDG